MKKYAIYPGSFDPPTSGHLDVIERAVDIFDKILVSVIVNPNKETLFSVEERVDMLSKIYEGRDEIEIASFSGLLVDFAKKREVFTIIRGLRAVSDFEYEFQMALMNSNLAPKIRSVYLMPSMEFTYISSSLIKEVFRLGGEVDGMVPEIVKEYLKKKLKEK